jgi:prophage antirepressor-like protein
MKKFETVIYGKQQLYDFNGKKVTLYLFKNYPRFVVIDICKILSIPRAQIINSYSLIDPAKCIGNEKCIMHIKTRDRQELTMSLSVLHELISNSKKRDAKNFSDWLSSLINPILGSNWLDMQEDMNSDVEDVKSIATGRNKDYESNKAGNKSTPEDSKINFARLDILNKTLQNLYLVCKQAGCSKNYMIQVTIEILTQAGLNISAPFPMASVSIPAPTDEDDFPDPMAD